MFHVPHTLPRKVVRKLKKYLKKRLSKRFDKQLGKQHDRRHIKRYNRRHVRRHNKRRGNGGTAVSNCKPILQISDWFFYIMSVLCTIWMALMQRLQIMFKSQVSSIYCSENEKELLTCSKCTCTVQKRQPIYLKIKKTIFPRRKAGVDDRDPRHIFVAADKYSSKKTCKDSGPSILVTTVGNNFIRVPWHGSAFIYQIKHYLSKKISIGAEEFYLHSGGKYLLEERRLCDYDISAGGHLHMSMRLLGGGKGTKETTNKLKPAKSSKRRKLQCTESSSSNDYHERRYLMDAIEMRCKCKQKDSCLSRFFQNNSEKIDTLFKYLKSEREGKSKEELEQYHLHSFYSTITNVQDCKQANQKLIDEYEEQSGDETVISEVSGAMLEKLNSDLIKFRLKHHYCINNSATSWSNYTPCRDVWLLLMGITDTFARAASERIKLCGGSIPRSLNIPQYDGYSYHDLSFDETFDAFADICSGEKESKIDIEGFSRHASTRCNDNHMEAVDWFNTYFTFYGGEPEPNSREVHLETMDKKDIYETYERDMKRRHKETLDIGTWEKVWLNSFPHVKIRAYKQVTGKCWTCYYINDAREKANSDNQLSALKTLHQMHKGGFYMPERNCYRQRRENVIRNKSDVTMCSIVIDGMDQAHCMIPRLGSAQHFGAAIPQHITGVLEHSTVRDIDAGEAGPAGNLFLYRNDPHVKKGANLTVCVLSRYLDGWKRRHKGRYPEELYVQLDGGSENANSTVLAYFEYLIAKRAIKKIVYSRSPTGHTHEDIDRTFSVLWTHFMSKICHTPQEYMQECKNAYAKQTYSVHATDVYIVPDYTRWFEPHVDTISGVHKEEKTQHQFRFEAVNISNYFPLGVKVSYRAYSSDRVIEILKKPRQNCRTRLGRLTGLEPRTRINRWCPSPDCIEGRNVEGEYYLQSLPQLANLTATPFNEKYIKKYSDLSVGLNSLYTLNEGADADRLAQWEEWFKTVCPLNDARNDYISLESYRANKKELIIPMFGVLKDPPNLGNDWMAWDGEARTSELPSFDIEWPKHTVASMSSVRTTLNPHPPAPVAIVAGMHDDNTDFVEEYRRRSEGYYSTYLNTVNMNVLKFIRKRRLLDSGKYRSTGGNKADLIKNCKEDDEDFIGSRFLPLDREDNSLIDRVWHVSPTTNYDQEVCATGTESYRIAVTKDNILQLKDTNTIGRELMKAFINLFNERETANKYFHDLGDRSDAYQRCYFYDSLIWDRLYNIENIPAVDFENIFPSEKFADSHELYFLINNGSDSWYIFIISMSHQYFLLYDPRFDGTIDGHPSFNCQGLIGKAMQWLRRACENMRNIDRKTEVSKLLENDWELCVFPRRYKQSKSNQEYRALTNDCDAGVYCLIAMEFFVYNVPLVIMQEDVQLLRRKLTYWLLNERLLK